MNYLNKIKAINKITLTKICKELKIDYRNLLNGRTTQKNEKRVYEKLIQEYTKIINEE